jgi:hypothetical protein
VGGAVMCRGRGKGVVVGWWCRFKLRSPLEVSPNFFLTKAIDCCTDIKLDSVSVFLLDLFCLNIFKVILLLHFLYTELCNNNVYANIKYVRTDIVFHLHVWQ